MTKAQLRTAIKREARIPTGANLDTLVDEIVEDILTDYCNLARYHELLVEGETIALVAEQQAYDLPEDFNHMAALRYGRGPNAPTVFREILLQAEGIRQTYSAGFPRFYRRIAGNQISFWPYTSIVATDFLTIDYYVTPSSLFSSESDEFPVLRLQSAVKKDAIARVQRFHSSNEEAVMTKQDGLASFNASNAGS